MKRMMIAMVVALACLAVGATAAHAHKKNFKSTVELTYQPGTYSDSFFGEVISNKGACEDERLVRLFRQEQGPNPLVGEDTTDANGFYSINLSGFAEPGTYYAKATKKRFGHNDRHKCKAARSNTVAVN